MIHHKKTLWILCGVVLLLTGVMTALLLYNPDAKDKDKNTADLRVVDIKYSGLAILSVENETGKYSLASDKEGKLYIEDQDLHLYSEENIKNSFDTLSTITAERLISEERVDLEKFGLDKPKATVTYFDVSGQIERLYLGMDEPLSGSSYVMCEGKPGIYLVSGSIGKIMRNSLGDYRDFNLFSPFSAEGANEELKSVELIKGDSAVSFEQQPFKKGDVVVYYKMTKPVVTIANWEKMDLYLFTPLKSLTADKWVEDTSDLAKYGLDSPDFVIDMDYRGERVRLLFKDIDGDMSYVTREGSGHIYEMSNLKYKDISESYTYFIGDTAYIRNITTIGNIGINIGGKNYSFDVAGEGQTLAFTTGGEKINSSVGISMYSILNNIPVKDKITQEDLKSNNVVASITYTLRDGKKETIEFIDMGNRETALRIDGEVHFKTYSSILDDIRLAVDNAAQAK